MKVFTPKTKTAIESLKSHGLTYIAVGLFFYTISEIIQYPTSDIPFVPGYEFILVMQGFGYLWRIRKIKKEGHLLKNYSISVSDNEIHFPKYYSEQDAPEVTGENLKTEIITLNNIKNLKISFGMFILKKVEPDWADKLKFPAYYFAKSERKEILALANNKQHV
jgi:hypothetical protein